MAKKSSNKQSERLFEEKLVPAKAGSGELFDVSYDAKPKPVECLGMTFPNDEDRRAHFMEKLREKLKDPAFRKIEGFPIGEDEDILALSDPPYYTACPNPFTAQFIAQYGKRYDPAIEYKREPVAADVSEARTEIIYTAHSYHTKVPPRAIARYILHFTSPGALVLDAFSGSGMTGVACGQCSDGELARECNAEAGVRFPILCDLSPAATFIASVYLNPPNAEQFAAASESLIAKSQDDLGDLWKTEPGDTGFPIEFQIWTEVFACPHCQHPVITERVVDATEDIGTAKEFPCAYCKGIVSKAPSKGSNSTRLERRLLSRFDHGLNIASPYLPRSPIFCQALVKGKRTKLVTTKPQQARLESLEHDSSFWYPVEPLIKGERYELKDYCRAYGITHIHHFYLPRQLRTYSYLWNAASSEPNLTLRNGLRFFIQSNALGMTVLNRFGPTHFSQVSRYFSGTLYVPSVVAETSPTYTYLNKRERLIKAFARLKNPAVRHSITTQSCTSLTSIPNDSIDYVFVDPPFGRNLQYSELNQIWEAWLRVKTNRTPEAVMDATRKREIPQYTDLMRNAFCELFRVLKPGRWLTVVFHNASNSVWFAIQESLMSAGFVIADVRTLDRESDTYKQSRQGLVKQDLVISTYKPSNDFEERFRVGASTEENAWQFVEMHLSHIPVAVTSGNKLEVIPERQNYLLFDRMVAFHVQRGIGVPLSASEFFKGLKQRYPERDDMYFLPSQVSEYEQKRMQTNVLEQPELFVSDEKSAIQWVRRQLIDKPATYQDLQPIYMREAQRVWDKHERPIELLRILEENFVHDSKGLWQVADSKNESHLEQLRQRVLMKEFQQYLDTKGKLKIVRTEALRAGFKEAWQKKDYTTIVDMAKRIPDAVIQEDQALLMYFDNASLMLGE
jgi:hypothetical protein